MIINVRLIYIGLLICFTSSPTIDAQSENYLYVADKDDIYQISETTGNRRGLIKTYFSSINFTNIVALAYSQTLNTLYFSDNELRMIFNLTLNGLVPVRLFKIYTGGKGEFDVFDGMVIDSDYGYIYVSNANEFNGGNIFRIKLDGSDKKIIYYDFLSKPRALILDNKSGYLYWTDWGNNPGIYKISTNIFETLENPIKIIVSSYGSWPNALAIQFQDNMIYWGDASTNSLSSSSIDGLNSKILYHDNETRFFAFAPNYKQIIYYTDWKNSMYLWMFDCTTSQIKIHSIHFFVRPCGIVYRTSTTTKITTTKASVTALRNSSTIATYFTEKIHCLSYPCGNGGTCVDLANDFYCICKPGFSAISMKICSDINECLYNSCENGGTCSNDYDRFRCICPNNYIGINCEQYKNSEIDASIKNIKIVNIPTRKYSICGGSVCPIQGNNFGNFLFLGAFLIPSKSGLDSIYAYASNLCTINWLCIEIPRVTESYVGEELHLILEFTGFNISLDNSFNILYIQNPILFDIQPRKPFIQGGILIYVSGENLEGIYPVNMTYEVRATNGLANQYGIINTECNSYNLTAIECPFKGFNYFNETFKEINNTNIKFYITVGFIMANYPMYRNISKSKPELAKSLYLTLKEAVFDPFIQKDVLFIKKQTITLRGQNLDAGATKESYQVAVGGENCPIENLYSNSMECLPPQTIPITANRSTVCQSDNAVLVEIFFKMKPEKRYLMYCLLYTKPLQPLEIMGIALGSFAFSVIVIITIICCIRKCNIKNSHQSDRKNNRISSKKIENKIITKNIIDNKVSVKDNLYEKYNYQTDDIDSSKKIGDTGIYNVIPISIDEHLYEGLNFQKDAKTFSSPYDNAF